MNSTSEKTRLRVPAVGRYRVVDSTDHLELWR